MLFHMHPPKGLVSTQGPSNGWIGPEPRLGNILLETISNSVRKFNFQNIPNIPKGSTEIKEPKEPKRSQRSSSKNRKLLGSFWLLNFRKKCLFVFLAPYFPYFTIGRSQHWIHHLKRAEQWGQAFEIRIISVYSWRKRNEERNIGLIQRFFKAGAKVNALLNISFHRQKEPIDYKWNVNLIFRIKKIEFFFHQ